MVIDISDYIFKDNRFETVSCSIDSKNITYNHASYPIVECKPCRVFVGNEESKTIDISCDAEITVNIPCDRCTEDVKYTFNISIERSLKLEDETIAESVPYIDDNMLDVDKLVFDEVLVDWPVKVLCKEDCKGLCPTCGINLNNETCGCDNIPKDPRMAKFKEVFMKTKEV